jgi:nucleoside-diphosphate-sugar epimerase
VRLPLVYGYGAKSNLKNLMKLINSKIPLPFGGIKNKRSLIGIDNLVDVLIRCMEHPNAAGQTFLISDGEDLSTPELILLIASAMGQPIKLFSIPKSILKFLGFILGKQKEMRRITESLQIDNSYAKQILNWTPPISVKEGIRRMIKGK